VGAIKHSLNGIPAWQVVVERNIGKTLTEQAVREILSKCEEIIEAHMGNGGLRVSEFEWV
jgi:DNA-directed RNA polymerase subunit L